MLVISRKIMERVKVGDVWVTVTLIEPGKVKLGIDAHEEIPIQREELLRPGQYREDMVAMK